MQKKFLLLEISAFELVAVNSPDSNENSCKRQSLPFTTIFVRIWRIYRNKFKRSYL